MKVLKVNDNEIKEFFGLLDIALKLHGIKILKSASNLANILDSAEELPQNKKVKTHAKPGAVSK